MRFPSLLRPGDTVALVAASGPCDPDRLAAGVRILESLGLHCQVTESCQACNGFLAGTDILRARDLHESFADTNVRAVFAARGGHGAQRLLPLLDFDLIRKNPKIFAGYSDVTALHIAFNQRSKLITFHAPMPAVDFGGETVDGETLASFRSALFEGEHKIIPRGRYPTGPMRKLFASKTYRRHATLQPPVRGLLPSTPIIGGNLTLVTASLGTPFEIDTRGYTLFLEEVNEEPYRVDRMLMHLKLAGKLDDAAGFFLGSFTPYTAEDLTQSLDDILKPTGKPITLGFPAGHASPNLTFPLG